MRLCTMSALVAILIALPTTQAAQLTYDVYGDTYAFSLEIEPTDPQFETIEFDLTVDAGELVLHGDPNSIEVPGEGGTGFNIWLVGFQWIEARFPFQGFAGTRVRDDRLYQRWFNETGRHARLTEATFIAQAEVSPSAIGQATLRMFRAGEVVGIASTPFGVPEPAAACLAGLCLAGAANAARRNWRHGGGR